MQIGHMLRQDDTIAGVALEWNPQGIGNRGRPTNTWRAPWTINQAGLASVIYS